MKTTGTRAKPRLIALVGPFIAVALVQAFVASLSIYTLSAVRGYVGGESLWSKGQKAAIFFLHQYAENGDEAYYREFESALSVPLGDRVARLALDVPPVDVEAARRGLLAGQLHESDVPRHDLAVPDIPPRPLSRYVDQALGRGRSADRRAR